MGSSLSPVLADIFMEWFEDRIFMKVVNKPKLWLRYVDDTFVVWPYDKTKLQEFLECLNNEEESIKFTVEIENNKTLPFLDVLVDRGNNHIKTSVYRKPTHTGQYIQRFSNHPDHVKRGVIRSLHARAINICSNKTLLDTEIDRLFQDFCNNGYSNRYIKSSFVKKNLKTGDKEVKGSLVIPYVKGLSEKIRRIAASFGLRTAFHSRLTLERLLCNRRPDIEMLDRKNIIYSIPCECGYEYLGETSRPLRVRLEEHKKNVKRGNTASSKLAEHVWEKQHHILWDNVKICDTETKWFERRFKESVLISTSEKCISQVSFDIPGIWAQTVRRCVTTNQ